MAFDFAQRTDERIFPSDNAVTDQIRLSRGVGRGRAARALRKRFGNTLHLQRCKTLWLTPRGFYQLLRRCFPRRR